jgi:protoporphyrinogen oxidase
MSKGAYILGGGVTGLAAGQASGLTVLEAAESPGGICSSYYVRSGENQRLSEPPADGEAYRFEIGGGHWIFGGDPVVLRFLRSLAPVKVYDRKSSVYFHKKELYVPFPLQNHLRALGPEIASQALGEMVKPGTQWTTMKEWLQCNFGPTLCKIFFEPFHELYTAGLHNRIAPQDAYKSPVQLPIAVRGAFRQSAAVGYNTTYIYPVEGLNSLAQRMASKCDLRYGKRVSRIDVKAKEISFGDDSSLGYHTLLSTLPLNRMMEMTGLSVEAKSDPHTSVLVLNIGAVRGARCPADHWLYNADTEASFHRVGFYSNVDRSFLPLSAQERGDRVSIYVEKGYVGGQRPSERETNEYAEAVIRELRGWDFIGPVEVVDPTWIDVAYTWSWPGSKWKEQALRALEEHDIYPVGRYARWNFQGISESIKDGFYAGASLRHIAGDN